MKDLIKKICITLGVGILFIFLYYYFLLPVFNFGEMSFYYFIALIIALGLTIYGIIKNDKAVKRDPYGTYVGYKFDMNGRITKVEKPIYKKFQPFRLYAVNYGMALGGIIVLTILFSIIGATIFNAKRYYEQLEVVEGSNEEFNTVFNYNAGEVQLPIIDSELAFKLAQARLSQYGAQYTIDFTNFTLISVHRNGKDELVRIAPLEYSNFFVSINRLNKGTIGYIEVNVITKEAKLVEFSDGLKYMPSAKLSKDLNRHIRFNYPTEITGTKYFEIDDNGKPYWVVPTIRKEIGVISGSTAKGVIIVDPINGDINRYNLGEEPNWVDRAVIETIADEQATNYFKYKNGWFNATFGQKKEVFQMSDGYNYFIKDGKTYYVSCITSPNESDQTSIGFVAINLKTKEAKKYLIDGITEMRAREIAENHYLVKAQAFTATWPILIDYNGLPTYFVVLKNDVQPQKMVFIDVATGIKVGMGDTIEQAKANYNSLLVDDKPIQEDKTYTGVITALRATTDNNEFMITGFNDKYFIVDVKQSISARFIQKGDNVKVTYKEYDSYCLVTKIEIIE